MLHSDAVPASSEIGPAGGCGAQDRGASVFFSEQEARRRIESELGELVPVERSAEAGVGPAVVYRLARGDAKGRVGFISAMSAPFCATCNRLRLTASGILRSCLFDGGEVDLKPILRGGGSNESIYEKLGAGDGRLRAAEAEVHGYHGNEAMSRIGDSRGFCHRGGKEDAD